MSPVVFTPAHTRRGPLVLVNQSYPAAQNGPAAPRLAPVGGVPGAQPVYLAARAAAKMKQLVAAVGGAGRILPVSGYRSFDEQSDIFNETLREKGDVFTRKYVALPGCSEHQTGLALDVAAADSAYDFIRPVFPETGLYARFRQLAAGYGYVERYPKGKTHITGIAHEPWHFRYVGRPHAQMMLQNGWVLEEYIEVLQGRQSYESALVLPGAQGADVRAFTLPVEENTALRLPAGVHWAASGNNAGGMVVTAWR